MAKSTLFYKTKCVTCDRDMAVSIQSSHTLFLWSCLLPGEREDLITCDRQVKPGSPLLPQLRHILNMQSLATSKSLDVRFLQPFLKLAPLHSVCTVSAIFSKMLFTTPIPISVHSFDYFPIVCHEYHQRIHKYILLTRLLFV